GVGGRPRDLSRLAGILTAIEREPFAAPRLCELQAALLADGEPPSKRLGRLVYLVELLDSARNSLFGIVAVFLLWTTQVALALEAWRRQTGPALGRWAAGIAEVEALGPLAG